MQATSPIPKQTVGRTFFAATLILGLVALMQLGTVGWMFIVRSRSAAQSEIGAAMSSQDVADTAKLDITDNPGAPDAKGGSSEIAMISTGTASPVLARPTPISRQAPPKATSPAQGRLNELAEIAKALRERGDMSTALTRLREALVLAPENPYIISEIAITYEKMGLKDKATEQWRRIHDMGESAGIYYAAADGKLKSLNEAPGEGQKTVDGFQPNSVLALVDITKVDTDDGSKKFTLKIPVKALPDKRIDVNDVVLQVFFYDLVDDKDIVQTNANITYRWATTPINWSDGDLEILEVDYSPSVSKVKEKRGESRIYFGYVVRIYYKKELQDMRAEPMKLLKQFPPPTTLSNEEMK